MNGSLHRFAVVLAALAVPVTAAAQVARGSRVRVMDEGVTLPIVVGDLVRLSGDSVTIATSGPLGSYPAASTFVLGDRRHLDVRTGITSMAKGGALVGGLIGGLVGYAGTPNPNNCAQSPTMCVRPAVWGAAGGAILGMLVGGMIGKQLRSESWTRYNPPRTRLTIVPAGEGMTIGISVAF